MSFAVPHIELSEESPDESTHVVTVRGEIHVSTAPTLSRCLDHAIEHGKSAVVVDLSGVEFIDSTGLSVLLNALRRVTREEGHMVLVCTNPTVLRLFEITRLDATFEIFDSRGRALDHVCGRDGRDHSG